MKCPASTTFAIRARIAFRSGAIGALVSNNGTGIGGEHYDRYARPALLALASVTDSLVTLATHIIRDLGLAGVSLLTISSGVIGVPGSEPTMLFAGFNVFQGHLSLIGIIVFGVLGDSIGASIAYAIGYFGRRELLERQGGKLHMSQQRLERAHGWFEHYGAPVIVVSRLIPFARAAFPYAAGAAKMPYIRFVLLATLGSIFWITGLGVLGREVGSNWQSWRHNLEYVDYAAAAAVAALIAYVVVRRIRSATTDVAA
jgi:membrane protein DedA with SNARE-associated domain